MFPAKRFTRHAAVHIATQVTLLKLRDRKVRARKHQLFAIHWIARLNYLALKLIASAAVQKLMHDLYNNS